ncbi:MAG: outer membrane lipoprotein LolB [Burkholderiaceae bacterium]|jgi:outer membrane lipoprotein LolB|nr:outer membrane lipoprotein LolB [Burkholderiaceae bacterium]
MLPPIDARRRGVIGALCAAAVLTALTGCAAPPATPSTPVSDTGPWSGRLSLTIATEQPQRFYAGFTLEGNADVGQLTLTSPLGNTFAALRWQPGRAELIQNSRIQTYASLDELTARITGAPIPVRALFAWLRGQNMAIDGWQADLSALAQGRLAAQRLYPAPETQLRLALDR